MPAKSGLTAVKKQDRGLGLIVFLLLLAFYAYTLALPLEQLDRFAPDDAFFYLRIAQNWLQGYGVTFDTVAPATGFHLGWFLLLSLWLKIVSTLIPEILVSPPAILWWATVLELLLALASGVVLWDVLRNRLNVPVGVVCLAVILIGFESAGYGMIMETQLLELALLLLLRFQLGLSGTELHLPTADSDFRRMSLARTANFGSALLVGLLITLSRADYLAVLLTAAPGVALYVRLTKGKVSPLVRWLSSGVVGGGLLGYLAIAVFSYAVSGWAIPTSFYLKAGPLSPAFSINWAFLEKLFQFTSWHRDGVVLASIALMSILIRRYQPGGLGCDWWFVSMEWVGVYALLAYHVAMNPQVGYWYYQPSVFFSQVFFFAVLGELWRLIPLSWLSPVPRVAMRTLGSLLILFVILNSTRRVQIRLQEYQTQFYDPRFELGMLLRRYIPPRALVFSEDFSGKLSFYSGLRLIDGDGLVNSPAYIWGYLRKGRVYDYLREKKVQYYVITRMSFDEYRGRKSQPKFEDHVTSFTGLPSAIPLRSDNCVLEYHYWHGEFWFAAVYALPAETESGLAAGQGVLLCVALP